MAYVVRAVHVDGMTETITTKMNTRDEALELAKKLRAEGLLALITGPDGKAVNETEGE
jgi:hypothetical protein